SKDLISGLIENSGKSSPPTLIEVRTEIVEGRHWRRPTKSVKVQTSLFVSGTDAHEMELRERRLVQAYQRYLQRKGARPRSYAIRLPGENSIACDLYD